MITLGVTDRCLDGTNTSVPTAASANAPRRASGTGSTGWGLGADDYLPKPFAFAELVARVHALCRRARPAPLPLVLAGLSEG